MKRTRKHFEALDMTAGKIHTRKLPKWRYNSLDLMEYLDTLDEEGFETEETGAASSY